MISTTRTPNTLPLQEKIQSIFDLNKKEQDIKVVFSPGRINLIGEHTDYNLGYVLPAAIDKGILVAIKHTTKNHSSVTAIDKEETYDFSLDTIKPLKDGGWRNYVLGVIDELLKLNVKISDVEIAFTGNVPGGAGLSSSAALENGIVFGFNELFNLGLTLEEMIFISQRAEHNFVGVKCGIMDQYASMFGEKGKALLLNCKDLTSELIDLNLKDHEFVFINTNVKHNLAESQYNKRRLSCEKVASFFKVTSLSDLPSSILKKNKGKLNCEDYRNARFVQKENKRVIKSVKAIAQNDFNRFGELLFKSHKGLRDQYQVSCVELDFLIDCVIEIPEVIGARMMGGGFGGCTLNLVKKGAGDIFQNVLVAYERKFKIQPTVFKVEIDNGTYLVDLWEE